MPDIAGITVDLAAVRGQALAPGTVSGRGGDAWRVPLIGITRHDPEHALYTRGADEQWDAGTLGGFGVWVRTVELIIAASEVGRLGTQQAPDDLDPFHEHVHPCCQGWEGNAEGAVLVFVPASA